jgi:hypothetical protein
MNGKLEWYVSTRYSPERGDELSEAFREDAKKVCGEIFTTLKDYMAKPGPKKRGASIIRSRVSNWEEAGEPVCMLVFMSVEKDRELPSQQAVFIGPHSFIVAKGKDIAAQFERFLTEEGEDGDICFVELPP